MYVEKNKNVKKKKKKKKDPLSLTQPYVRPMHQCTTLSRGCLGVGLVYILVHYILIEYRPCADWVT